MSQMLRINSFTKYQSSMHFRVGLITSWLKIRNSIPLEGKMIRFVRFGNFQFGYFQFAWFEITFSIRRIFEFEQKRACGFSSRASFEQDLWHSVFEPSEFKQKLFERSKIPSKTRASTSNFLSANFEHFLPNRASKNIFFEHT